ncbi:MAG: hypothetical protein ACFCU2_01605 [Acidimicrobiia bacterium]
MDPTHETVAKQSTANEVPINEVRVHGVSGTPPREMLYTDPVPRLDGDQFARIFRKRASIDSRHRSGRPYNTEAFHWGSLTTGHWLTSVWILLAPFAFANVAGWMALRRSAFHRSTIRLAGLALTCLGVTQMGYLLVAVPLLYASANGWGDRAFAIVRGVTALGYVLSFGAVVLRLSTQSHFDPLSYRRRFELLFSTRVAAMKPDGADDDARLWDDPATSQVTEPAMWRAHPIVHRLRRVHYAAGQFVVCLILSGIADSDPMRWAAVGGLGLTALLLVLTATAATNRLVLMATAWMTTAALGVALAAVAMFALSDVAPDIDAVHRSTLHVAIALGITAALTIFTGIPGIGSLTIATFLGGAFGVGAGLVAEDLLSVGDNLVTNGGAWVLPASLVFVLLVTLVAVALTFTGPPGFDGGGPVGILLTRITRRSKVLLTAAAAFGLLAGTIAVVQACLLASGMCQPDALTEFAGADLAVIGLLVLILVLLAIRVFRFKPFAAGFLALLAVTITWVGVSDPQIGSIAPFDYLRALPLSRTLIFVAPTYAIGRSVLGAYRQGASSRKVGVIWDVASFWPRWFHPLAPPAYGPKVVTELRGHIESGGVEVLAAHSQGSVIAAIATHQASLAGKGMPSGLITYGSPIGLLYLRLFPDSGIDRLIETLPSTMRRGWTNLWRVDDPIGGEPIGGAVNSVLDERGSGHSGYELGGTFREARDRSAN